MEPSVDVLNRKAILNTILEIINKLSRNKESVTFAIDGEWGCGKSFLLNMIEDQLQPIQNDSTSDSKYFILHYNCWKYDYYDEPLIAVVSLILEEIEKREKLFSAEQKAIAMQEISNITETKNGIMISENLIKNKGFDNVVILVNNGKVNIVLNNSKLNQEQISQIQNIIENEFNVKIQDIIISFK